MTLIRDLAIRTKLVLMMMVAVCVAVALAGGAWILHEATTFRTIAEDDLSVQAKIVGDNCAAALEFDDARTAQETLGTLKRRNDIVAACVFRADGSVLASYASGLTALSAICPSARSDSQQFEARHLMIFRRVIRNGQTLGTVFLRSNLQPHYSRLTAGIVFACTAMLVSVFLAFLLASHLHHMISKPILNLATVTDQVSQHQDYKIRATKVGDDEIGRLTDGFNHMLQQIEERDSKLRLAYSDLQFNEQRFRQLAETIREVFWMTDPLKNEMIYISPGYQAIWGRTCESLVEDPQSWLEAIHAEDRERVKKAALTKQSQGSYDEEYRIMRPDGSLRWIHDRAFPISNADGHVYRIAGIAEDITEFKQAEMKLHQLSARILQTQDEERRRIARDLHEVTSQNLAALGMCLEVIKKSPSPDDEAGKEALAEAVKLTRDCSREVRTMSYLLHPPLLDEFGLDTALRWFVEGFSRRSNIEINLLVTCGQRRFPQEVEMSLFRIVQECLINAYRHANSSTATIRLIADHAHVRLEVQDAGRGFPNDRGSGPGPELHGVGIAGMRERVEHLKGQMEILNNGQGTSVRVIIPLAGSTL